jgi:hypothetical protein
MTRLASFAVVALMLGLVAEVQAGGYPPVCMAVERIVWEPDEAAPTRIQIWGSFAFLKEGTRYGPPVRGYLYYSLLKGHEDECRKQWKDLSQLVAKNHLVTFGMCNQPRVDGDLQQPGEKRVVPTAFPLMKLEANFAAAEEVVDAKILKQLRSQLVQKKEKASTKD